MPKLQCPGAIVSRIWSGPTGPWAGVSQRAASVSAESFLEYCSKLLCFTSITTFKHCFLKLLLVTGKLVLVRLTVASEGMLVVAKLPQICIFQCVKVTSRA